MERETVLTISLVSHPATLDGEVSRPRVRGGEVIDAFCSWMGLAFQCSSGPFGNRLLLPETIGLSGIAWLCLIAEWGFMRVLKGHFLPSASPGFSSPQLETVASAAGTEGVAELDKRSPSQRDIGKWFKGRFPKVHKFFSWISWILLPAVYVIATSLESNGNLQAIPVAILRLAVIAPLVLQVFWIPGGEVQRLKLALSQTIDRETGHSAYYAES